MKYTVKIDGLATTQQSCIINTDVEGFSDGLTRAVIDERVAYSPKNGGVYFHKITRANIRNIEKVNNGYSATINLRVDGEDKYMRLPMQVAEVVNQDGNTVRTKDCEQPAI